MDPERHSPAAGIALVMFSLACCSLAQEYQYEQSIRTPEAPLYQKFLPNPNQASLFRLGPFSGNAAVGVGYTFTDNANLTETNKISLNQASENVDFDMAWTLSPFNRIDLALNTQLQENFYSNGRNTLNLEILPGSEMRLQSKIGDVLLQAFEQLSITQDPVSDAAVAGQTNLNRLTNTAGVSALVPLSHVDFSLEFDYTYSDILGGTNALAQNGGVLRNSLHLGSRLGIEATPSLSYGLAVNATYNAGAGANDTKVLSGGGFLRGHLTRLIEVDSGVGILVGEGPSSGKPNYYAYISARHQISRNVQLLLGFSHDSEFSTGLSVARNNNGYLTARANLTRRWTVSVGPFVNFGTVLTGTLPGSYTQYGVTIDSSFAFSQKLSADIGYRFAKRDAGGQSGIVGGVSGSYTQNLVSLNLRYHF